MKLPRVLLFAGLAVLSACSRPSPSDPPGSAAAAAAGSPASAVTDVVVPANAVGVKIAEVRPQSVPEYISVAGRIQADPARVVRVFPPASGRLVTLAVRLGDRVAAGQVLATLQSSDVAGARADYEKAQIDARRCEQSYTRAAMLFENQVLPEKDYLDAKAAAEGSRAEVARARQRLSMLGAAPEGDSDRIELKAPRAGVVIDVSSAPGELSRSLDNASPVCTLADLGVVWAVGDVYEKDLDAFGRGGAATVTAAAYPGREWQSSVSTIADTIDPATRTVKVRVELPNADRRLKPEMFVSIRVLHSTSSKIVLPSAAVVHDGSRTWVLVRTDGRRYRRQDVVLGRTLGPDVEIAQGLNAGDVVVVEGASLLRPGAV